MVVADRPRPPVVDATGVTFRLADPTGRLRAVRLVQEIGLAADRLNFIRRAGSWSLTLPLPAVDRMEYRFELVDHNDQHATITDPANPLRAAGAFGAKSVVQYAGYREPEWLALPGVEHTTVPLAIPMLTRDAVVTGTLWSPASLDADAPALLLVVHDGPEYAALGSLTRCLAALIGAGALPPVRAALLAPGDRNGWYSADPSYARALCTEIVPALDRLAPTTARIGVGVSLGALAMLHAHQCYPTAFDGLLLQSGSFFTRRLDAQERAFAHFAAVTGFVASIERGDAPGRAVPTALTCGSAEENLANNCAMTDHLRRLGYPVQFTTVRDAHNYTAWRDAFAPACIELVAALAGAHAS